jgi:uncharacterized protein with HEPN domain
MGRDSAYILDIFTSAQLVRSYMEGVSLDELLADIQLQDSVIRRIEVIGEAAGRISPQFQEAHPEIPWQAMIGMRNRMIHGYDDIDFDIVWNTTQESIPHLLELIEPLLDAGTG